MTRPLPPETCATLLPHLEAWFDRELDDPRLASEIERHLGDCADCRADVDAMRQLREGLRAIPRTTATAPLYESIESTLTPPAYRARRQERVYRLLNHPALSLGAAAVAVVILAAVWNLQSREAARARSAAAPETPATAVSEAIVAAPLIEDHVTLLQNEDGSVLLTHDADELRQWFAARLPFEPPVPAWPWARQVGGRVCKIKGQRVARIEFEAEHKTFTLFIQDVGGHLPEAGGSSGATASVMEHEGYRTATWRADGFSYVLVARLAAEPVFEYLAQAD
jgi:anti-sigma factor RsiW